MSTVTIGSSEYEVYSDVAEADVYFNGSSQFSDWAAFTDDEKARGLVSATRLLDRQQWQGTASAVSPGTALAFPRDGLTDCGGNEVTAAESLAFAVEASQLLALDILSGEAVETSVTTEDLTKRLKAGSVEIENFRAQLGTNSRFPVDVMELIGCFLAGNVSIAGSIASGTDGTALDDDFTLTTGF